MQLGGVFTDDPSKFVASKFFFMISKAEASIVNFRPGSDVKIDNLSLK